MKTTLGENIFLVFFFNELKTTCKKSKQKKQTGKSEQMKQPKNTDKLTESGYASRPATLLKHYNNVIQRQLFSEIIFSLFITLM